MRSGDRAAAKRSVTAALERLLRTHRIGRVHIADGSVAPPVLAYVTAFPRLSVAIDGMQPIELTQHGRTERIVARRGQAVFVPSHAWDLPRATREATVLTCLFGPRQIGFSLVEHRGAADADPIVTKTSVHGAHDGISRHVLQALNFSAVSGQSGRLGPLLVESLLHACVHLLRQVDPPPLRKAALTYETICLYVAEHFQDRDLNRESVAAVFGLAPNHISRLFAVEGRSRFNDHLNTVRINRAKFMLQNYRMTVKEIAVNSGYADAAYFCRVFRKITGLTPLQYRSGLAATGDGTSRAVASERSNIDCTNDTFDRRPAGAGSRRRYTRASARSNPKGGHA